MGDRFRPKHAAAIDRLVHHSDIYQIQGESYRKKQAMKINSNTSQVN